MATKVAQEGDTPFIPRNKLGGERNLVFFGVAEALYINRLFSLLTLHFGRLYESLSATQFAHSACAVKFSLVASQSAFNIIFLSYRYYYHAVYLLCYWSVIPFLCLYILFAPCVPNPPAYFLRIDGTFLPPGGCKGSKILQNRTYSLHRPTVKTLQHLPAPRSTAIQALRERYIGFVRKVYKFRMRGI